VIETGDNGFVGSSPLLSSRRPAGFAGNRLRAKRAGGDAKASAERRNAVGIRHGATLGAWASELGLRP